MLISFKKTSSIFAKTRFNIIKNLQKLAKTCKNLQKLAKTCKNLQKLAKTCKNLQKLAVFLQKLYPTL
jgi:hypothetical protein